METGLFQLLTQSPTLQTAVGVDANGVTRVYNILAPQGAIVPFLVLSRISTGDHYSMAGTTGIRDGLFQITCYATSYKSSRNISKDVRQILQNYTGTLPDGTVVIATFVEKDFDLPYEVGAKNWVYPSVLHIRFWYQST